MRSGSLRVITSSASAMAWAAPPMSFFMLRMPSAGLRSRPPVSKHTPLPTMATCGCASSPQRSSIRRGARWLARPTAWIAGKLWVSRSSPLIDFDLRAEALGQFAGDLFELVGPHVLGRRVDQVAHAHARGELGEGFVVALHLQQRRLAQRLLVAVEAVAAQAPAQVQRGPCVC